MWLLATTHLCKGRAIVEWKVYKKLHKLIAQTLDMLNDTKEYNPKRESKIARADWVDDLNRHNQGGDCLNHEQFSNSFFELVDVHCQGGTMLDYIEYIRNMYSKMCIIVRTHCLLTLT